MSIQYTSYVKERSSVVERFPEEEETKVRALLGAPLLRDRRAVLRQAHNLKVARATRAPASSLAVATDEGYFTPRWWKPGGAHIPYRLFPAPVWQWCKSQLLRFERERSQVRVLPRTQLRGACSSAVEH